MLKNVKRLIIMSVALMATPIVTAQPEQNSEIDKDIQIRNSRTTDNLKVTLTPYERGYKVGEKIRFNIYGNQDFYLYLFTINQRTGQANMILPNRIQSANKYHGNTIHKVPNAQVEFYSDRSGTEKLIYVASKKYLNWDISGYKKVGDFLRTSIKSLDDQIQKQIVIRNRNNGNERRRERTSYSSSSRNYRDSNVYVGEINFEVYSNLSRRDAPEERRHTPSSTHPIMFIETTQDEYRIGEYVAIVFGADQAGFVHLFSRDPGYAFRKVSTKRVNGDNFHRLVSKASRPAGTQDLLLIFSQYPDMDPKNLENNVSQNWKSKGLTLSRNSGKQTRLPYVLKSIKVKR